MSAFMPHACDATHKPRWSAVRHGATAALVAASLAWPSAGLRAAESPPSRSAMDAPLLYQLLIGEMELSAGRAANAFEVLIDAARRTRDEELFRRAVQVAIQGRSVEQAQAAVRIWRQTLPQSIEAWRLQFQLAVSINRLDDAAEAFLVLVERSPADTRRGVVAALPQMLERSADRKQVMRSFAPALETTAKQPVLRAVSLSVLGRLWASADEPAKALAAAEQAASAEPLAREPALLAMELMTKSPAAESLVKRYLDQPGSDAAVRLAYGQSLAQQQRYIDALAAIESVTKDKPDMAQAWLTLGALQLELRHPKEAEAALQQYLQLASEVAPAPQGDPSGAMQAARASAHAAGRNQAHLMLSQAAEQRGDFAAASAWLERVDSSSRGLDVVARRASLLARQGKLDEGRSLIRAAPETTRDDARLKLVTEGQLLRENKRWQEAYAVLGQAVQSFPQDVDLVYEQAMMAEKLNRLDDMERLLRQVIAARPDHQHAYNALGYSLADRGLRLGEARELVTKALELAPGDPFITDSLGWVEYRAGNREEALRLLQKAWRTRPDTEIGAHLGEVLWVMGRKDEARRIWSDARKRDANNDVLKETLARLRVDL